MFNREFKYKDCTITSIEQGEELIIRIHNRFGFRWFRTKQMEKFFLKVKEAYRIEQDIIDNGLNSKYGFKENIL